jgi:hypothetical protein
MCILCIATTVAALPLHYLRRGVCRLGWVSVRECVDRIGGDGGRDGLGPIGLCVCVLCVL